MDRNSRENGPTDININLGPWIKELDSLGKNMWSKGTCYLDKLEHRIAQRGFSSLLVGEAQETWFPGFEIWLTQPFSLLRATVSGLHYVLEIKTWIFCPAHWSKRPVSQSLSWRHIHTKREWQVLSKLHIKTILKVTEGIVYVYIHGNQSSKDKSSHKVHLFRDFIFYG